MAEGIKPAGGLACARSGWRCLDGLIIFLRRPDKAELDPETYTRPEPQCNHSQMERIAPELREICGAKGSKTVHVAVPQQQPAARGDGERDCTLREQPGVGSTCGPMGHTAHLMAPLSQPTGEQEHAMGCLGTRGEEEQT